MAPLAGVDESAEASDVEESPRPERLRGVTCVVRGGGAPFPESCGSNQIEVFSKRDGVKPLAEFDATSIDVTWGLFDDAGRASVHARSGGLALTGFSDPRSMTFRLRREAMIVAEHVWLKRDAPVKIRRGLPEGASVEVLGELAGVASIPAKVGCDALAFDPAADEVEVAEVPVAHEDKAPVTILHPKQDLLRLRDAPGGRVITTLMPEYTNTPIGNSTSHPNFHALDLEVIDEKASSYRVRFDTEFTRFDVWIEANAAEGRGVGSAATGLSRCNGGRASFTAKRWRVNAQSPIHVGKTPAVATDGSLVVMKGAHVAVVGEADGFVEIQPWSSIHPPDDQSFWIPKASLDSISR